MKVIDILNEGKAVDLGTQVLKSSEIGERVYKSILKNVGWSATQKIAFKDSVELCTDVLEQMLLKDQDITTPAATRAAWAAIQPRIGGTPWIKNEFVQEIFDVSAAEARDRVAKKAGALKPNAEPVNPKAEPAKPTEEPVKPKEAAVGKPAFEKAKKVANFAYWSALGIDIAYDVYYEYYTNQQEYLRRTTLPKTHELYMSPEDAMKADVIQKTILYQRVLAATLIPGTVLGLAKFATKLATTPLGWLSTAVENISPTVWPAIKKLWSVKRPSGMSDAEFEALLKLKTVNWENLSSAARSSILTLWLAVLNSNERYPGAANWKVKGINGADSGYTVGTLPGFKRPDGLTPKEMITFYAINDPWMGTPAALWVMDFSQWAWNLLPDFVPGTGDTQKQAIQRAAGQPVTPNTVAKPPKQEKKGNTTWHGDWEK